MDPTYQHQAQGLGLTGTDAARYVEWQKTLWSGITSLLQNLGAFLGIFMFSYVSIIAGRRPAFAIFFPLALPLRRSHDVQHFRDRVVGTTVSPRDAWQAASGVTRRLAATRSPRRG
jgi:hypothetical protein